MALIWNPFMNAVNVQLQENLNAKALSAYVQYPSLFMSISCRTGSKLGISPLMLAAMNGHTSTVKLLLEKGSDISAQVCL